MWHVEHSLETSAAPEAIWRRWGELDSWPEWHEALAQAELRGPLVSGARAILTLQGGRRLRFQVEACEEERTMILRSLGLVGVLRFVHRMEASPLGSRLVHRVEFFGLGSWMLHLTVAKRLRQSLVGAARRLAHLAALRG